MITIGTTSFGYNHWRNFAGLPFENVKFKKIHDIHKIPAYFNYKIRKKISYCHINRFNDLGLNKVDLYHFFNTITPIKRPWVVTYETSLPRQEPDFLNGYEWLSSQYCKSIIAFSNRAYNIQLNYLDKYPEYKETITSKMIVLPPAQSVLIEDIFLNKFNSNELTFTFTGRSFYRKGGWEILQAFEIAKELRLPVKLNLISNLERNDYRDEFITDEMILISNNIIKKNPLITHYFSLPNSQVLDILKKSHVTLLPSWGETYGYSLLEGMAMGCIPISTDLKPFPEFVKEEFGYLINIDKIFLDYPVSNLESPYINFDMYKCNSEKIIKTLINIMLEMVNNRDELKTKAFKAIEHIKVNHNPLNNIKILNNIYNNALN